MSIPFLNNVTVTGLVSTVGGNSNQWNSVYTNVNSNSANYILDGGNTKSANISIGTNDNYNLTLETNNSSRLLLTTNTLSGNSSRTSFNAGSATGLNSFAVGTGKAFGDYSHAEGTNTTASGNSSHAEGDNTKASGDSSHAEGSSSTASGNYSHAEGNSIASGNNSHAEGSTTAASGIASHAEGNGTNALGNYSHAEGSYTDASGDSSHAEGYGTTALGNNSHAEGGYTIASGTYSHAEGGDTTASGTYGHAEGYRTRARGNSSHAAGQFSEAAHDKTWVWHGSTATDYVSSTRTNQFVVSAKGGVYFPGNVGIGTDNNSNALTVNGLISATSIVSRSVLPQLPVPKVMLTKMYPPGNFSYIQYLTGGYVGPNTYDVDFDLAGDLISLKSYPILYVKDFTDEILSNYQIFIEMVKFKKAGKYGPKGMSYVVPVGSDVKPWGDSFYTRSGDNGVQINDSGIIRYNHLPVTYNGQKIDLSQCLNGHFRQQLVGYFDTSNQPQVLDCIIPFPSLTRYGNSSLNRRFGYARCYRPLYIAFRYIAWLPENNNGRGQIIEGPLSPTIRISNEIFPFHLDDYYSSIHGVPVVNINPLFTNKRNSFTCNF